MKRDADLAGFFAETFALIQENPVPVAFYAAVLTALAVASDYVSLNPELIAGLDPMRLIGMGAFAGLIMIAITFVAQYLLTRKFLESRGEILASDNRIWLFVGMNILMWLGLMFGFLLLIVPGLVLLTRWTCASALLVSGREGVVSSLGQSWEMTDGHGWPIFGGYVVLFIATVFLSAAFFGGMFATDQPFSLLTSVGGNLVSNVASAIFVAYGVGVYHLLNDNSAQAAVIFE